MAIGMASETAALGARPLEAVLADLERLTEELVAVAGPSALDAADAAASDVSGLAVRLTAASPRVRAVGSRLQTARLAWLPRIEAEGIWAVRGARTFASWLATAENVEVGTAKREVRTATTLREHLPATLEAAAAGRIGADHLRILVDGGPTSEARREALAGRSVDPEDPAREPVTGEERLLRLAVANKPSPFRRLVQHFARITDPESDDRGYKDAVDREFLELAKTFGGYHVAGFLTDESGLALATALASVMGAPTAVDDRTGSQRRAAALADVARIVLDNGRTGTGAAVRPHLAVTVSWSELQAMAARAGADPGAAPPLGRLGRGPSRGSAPGTGTGTGLHGPGEPGPPGEPGRYGWPGLPAYFTETGAPVPASLLRKLACDSEVTRIVFGPDSQVLDVGRAQRTVTGQLRRAVIARDQHCVYPDCDQPPGRCDVHHAERHWADGGETSVRNAALLCRHHHTLVDTGRISMRWGGRPDGDQALGAREDGTRSTSAWAFTDRHGKPITGYREHSAAA